MEESHHYEFATVTRGQILAEEFVAGYALTRTGLARALGVSRTRISGIVNNRCRITADTAVGLGLFFGTTPEFWQNLQAHYDLKLARRALPPETAEKIAAQSVAADRADIL